MIVELRTYTINKGAVDAFLETFERDSVPLHEAAGIPIVATWINRPQNEFIWIRTFEDEADREAKLKVWNEERQKRGIVLGNNVAKMEWKEIEPVLVSALKSPA